jgi:hypothetical protein
MEKMKETVGCNSIEIDKKIKEDKDFIQKLLQSQKDLKEEE